jgi:hypothetical protein
MNIMDLSNIKVAQEAQTLELLHPVSGEVIKDDSGKAFSIDLLSSDTNSYKAEFSKLMKAARENKNEQTARDAEEKACSMLAKITTGCNLIMDGKKVKFSEEVMKDLYFNPEYTWIREQVEAFIRERSNFIKG